MLGAPPPFAPGSHKTVDSCLPTELLAEVFFYAIESGLQDDNTRFATGTFNFLQVCRRWNEVAVSTPKLWAWWVPGAVNAWALFHSRSKTVPFFLSWRSQVPRSVRDFLMDPAIPGRIRGLDFAGTSEQLVQFLRVFDARPPVNASSIRFKISTRIGWNLQQRLASFLSSHFPNLSRVSIDNFLPDLSSPIFTTSSLTSLKLALTPTIHYHYPLFEFSQMLQRHPNLQELDLNWGAIPMYKPSEISLIPLALPRLATLRLYGTGGVIGGFIDFVGMSSPLHTVVIRFSQYVPAHASTVKRIIAAYYECQGLDHSRKPNNLEVSFDEAKEYLTFSAQSRPSPTQHFKPSLGLQFPGMDFKYRDAMVDQAFPLFPLGDLQELVIEGLDLGWRLCCEAFQKMENLSCLRLHKLSIGSAMNCSKIEWPDKQHQPALPKLESLVLCHLDLLLGSEHDLLEFLRWRLSRGIASRELVIQSCRVHTTELKSELEGLVGVLGWNEMTVVGSDYEGSDSSMDEFDDLSTHGPTKTCF